MTTLILKFAGAPSFGGLKRLAGAVADFIELLDETKQMARDAERKFHLMIE
jgi:hypothetical protein